MTDPNLDELQRIWDLKEKGAISDQEYSRLKAQILGNSAAPKEIETGESPEPDFAARVQPSQKEAPKGPTTRQAVGIGCGVIFALLVIAGIAGSNSGQNATSNTGSAVVPTNDQTAMGMNATSGDATATANDNSPWTYSQDDDKVRGGTTYHASTTSTNSISQAAPYDSDTTMQIDLRKSPAYGTDVILTISSGQMMCPSYEGCSGTVRFDNGRPQTVRFNGPADDSSDTVFIEGAKAFIAKLKSAKKLTIEKTLYQAGNPQFEFDVHGLKWNH